MGKSKVVFANRHSQIVGADRLPTGIQAGDVIQFVSPSGKVRGGRRNNAALWYYLLGYVAVLLGRADLIGGLLAWCVGFAVIMVFIAPVSVADSDTPPHTQEEGVERNVS